MDQSSLASISKRYANYAIPEVEFATVGDYSDSLEHLPELCYQNDLKDIERPWAVKAILSKIPKGGHLLEVGGGEPTISNFLHQLGYKVSLIDPFEGGGNGPVRYEFFKKKYPNVNIIRGTFNEDCGFFPEHSFDCIFSISVLEHIPTSAIPSVIRGIKKYAKPNSYTIHNVDHVQLGNGDEWSAKHLGVILDELGHAEKWEALQAEVDTNPEIYFLSAAGHLLWKGDRPYHQFPFRRCVALNICSRF